jgi:hypothetical protein
MRGIFIKRLRRLQKRTVDYMPYIDSEQTDALLDQICILIRMVEELEFTFDIEDAGGFDTPLWGEDK